MKWNEIKHVMELNIEWSVKWNDLWNKKISSSRILGLWVERLDVLEIDSQRTCVYVAH